MPTLATDQKIRLLIVDDSAYNRRNIADVFAEHPDVEVVGKAQDGEEALRLALMLKPDAITLDLEMPRMDGFTFLRILMARQPTPVIVVSSYSQKENVFKALELGALDFVAKPDRQIAPDAVDVRDQILQKVQLVKSLRPSFGAGGMRKLPTSSNFSLDPKSEPPRPLSVAPPRLIVAIASSTGGPSALLEIFAKIPKDTPAGFVVAQHMPDKFTRTFAERLDRRSAVRTREAEDGDLLGKVTGFVCPGRQCVEVSNNHGEFRVHVKPPTPEDRYVPSGDRLMKSVAAAVGSRSVGVVLTGMGDDGVEGARAIREAGGIVICESQETAVVFGMPGAVIKAGLHTHVLSLPQIVDFVSTLAP